MARIGSALVYIRAKVDKLKTDLLGAESAMDLSTSKMSKSIGRINWKAVGLAAAGAGVAVGAAMNKSIQAASDLQETVSKFDTVFGAQKEVADAFVVELRSGFAMSEKDARSFMAAMQDLLVPMGMNADNAAQLSGEIVKLSADLGSFNNLPTAQVMGDIQSALVGNYETMKKYGVVLSASTVQQKALEMGLADSKDQLTANHKAQAAYQMIVEGSTFAIGDMARTVDSFANLMKQNEAVMGDLWADLGKVFLPLASEALKAFTNLIKNNKDGIISFAQNIVWLVEDLIWLGETAFDWFKDFGDHLTQVTKPALESIGGVTRNLTTATMGLNQEVEATETAYELAKEASDNTYAAMNRGALDALAAFEKSNKGMVEVAKKAQEETTKDHEANLKLREDNWSAFVNVVDQSTQQLESDQVMSWNNIKDNWTQKNDEMEDNWSAFTNTIDQSSQKLESDQAQTWFNIRDSWTKENKTMTDVANEFYQDVKDGAKQGFEKFRNYAQSAGDSIEDFFGDVRDVVSETIGTMVDDLIDGTLDMDSAMDTMTEGMVDSLGNFATKMFDKVFDTIVDLIAVNIGLGAAESGASKGWAGALAAAAEIGLYTSMAIAAVLAARGIQGNWAEGGWIEGHP